MNLAQTLFGLSIFTFLIGFTYYFTGWVKIRDCLLMWATPKYWTNYNIVEATSYFSKIAVIISQVIFGITVWWFYVITLVTSLALIWASNKKILPTLIVFNTLWVLVSCLVLAKTFV
jgi:hypothetical protein